VAAYTASGKVASFSSPGGCFLSDNVSENAGPGRTGFRDSEIPFQLWGGDSEIATHQANAGQGRTGSRDSEIPFQLWGGGSEIATHQDSEIATHQDSEIATHQMY